MEKNVIVLIVLIVTSFIYLKLASKFNIVDQPNERSSHDKVTVRGGGIIFPIAILIFFFFNDLQYPFFVFGVLLISFVSFLDDIYSLSVRVRLTFQIISIFLILYQIDFTIFPLYFSISLLVIGVGFINMFNFMDGVNGMTGIYSLILVFFLFLINLIENIVSTDLLVFTAISLVVFGFYNFRKKALFFAGDIGSISLGIFFFFIGILFICKLSSPLFLLLVLIYGVDVGCTIVYRAFLTKENVLSPHRHHLYEKLVDVYKFSHIKVSLIYSVLQVTVNCIIYKAYKLDLSIQLLIFFGLIVLFIVFYIFLFRWIENKRLA